MESEAAGSEKLEPADVLYFCRVINQLTDLLVTRPVANQSIDSLFN